MKDFSVGFVALSSMKMLPGSYSISVLIWLDFIRFELRSNYVGMCASIFKNGFVLNL